MKKIIRGEGTALNITVPTPPTGATGSATLSTQYATLVDLIAEGEIEGFATDDPLESIYLDGVQLKQADGTLNFQNVTIDARPGTQSQDYMPAFSDTEVVVAVNVEAKNTGPAPVTVTITDPDINQVRVTISVPQLFNQGADGSVQGNVLDFQIQTQSNGGGFVDRLPDALGAGSGFHLSGKVTNKYERSFVMPLTGSAPWDIKLIKKSADQDTVSTQNKLFFDSYTQIIDAKLAYPNSALIGIRFDASQFSEIPKRGYDVKLLKIQVPSNSTTRDDGSLTYSGSWDGTFRTGWSNNPAWCFYDMLTNDRYGLGQFITDDQIDKWSLFQIGKYCDDLVSDGAGGLEPRFSCNLYLQTRAEAFKVISDMASIFRGMAYWSNGVLTAVQDAPSDPAMLFTPANVLDGLFTYAGASLSAMHTVALVTWNDPTDLYQQKIEYVEDQAAILRLGIVETSLYAIGCTSRSQANRIGRWLLYTEQNESDTVSFSTALEGAVCRPGQIINIADPVRAGVRLGGRILSATSMSITVDDNITVSRNGGILYVMLPDGTIDTRTVLADNSAPNVINITDTFSITPAVGAMWLLSSSGVQAQTFRVIAAKENDQGQYEITAISHDPRKFDAVENDLILSPRDITNLSEIPDQPGNVIVSESLYESQAEVRVKITLSWPSVATASSYLVRYRYSGGNWALLPETFQNDIDILDVQPGIFDFDVTSISALGKKSPATATSKEIFGKLLNPSDVSSFSLIPVSGTAHLSWDKATDLDVLVGGSVRIRWTPATTDQAWANAIDIIPSLAGTATTAIAPLVSGTYMAKFIDSSDLASDTEALIVTTVPAGLALNVVNTMTESPSFPGSKTNCEVIDDDGLSLSSAVTFDEVLENIDDVTFFDSLGGLATSGTYLFASTEDLTAVLTSRVTASIQVEAFALNDFIDARVALMDDWLDIDGDNVDDVFATLYLRTTLTDPGGSPAWTEWKPFVVGEYTARAFQFKLELSTEDVTHNIKVTGLSVVIDMPDRTLNIVQQVSGVGVDTITFVEPFFAAPAIAITAYNLATGDYWQITSADKTGFSIVFKNSSGTAVSRTFDVLAKGYGRQVA